MPQNINPLIKEVAEETKRGGVSRRDFFKYAAKKGDVRAERA